MKIEDWFHGLRCEAETIQEKWPKATEQERLKMADQLFYLRQVSDRVVDLWIQFEERLSHTIRFVKQLEGHLPSNEQEDGAEFSLSALKEQMIGADNQSADQSKSSETGSHGYEQATSTASASHAHDKPQSSDAASHAYEPLFRRGEGFYHLRMYPDAKECFAQLIAVSPDWEIGRLYYAHSQLFSEERVLALREFRLLANSASSPNVAAISYNALGCMLAEEGQWLEAAQAFKTALETKQEKKVAQYNLALCYLLDGDAQEALDEIDEYLQSHPHDWEAQMLWLRAAQMLKGMDVTQDLYPPESLRLPVRQLESTTLQEMAALYESIGNYHRAQICYYFLTEKQPKEGWTWHGLAWNTWLIAGTRRAITLLKKAISLSPQNLDFVFSYGWMMLFDGRIEEAMAAFRSMLKKQRNHRLAQSGMISAYEKLGDFQAAKLLAKTFLQDGEPFVRSLGLFHMGRLSIAEGNWRMAEQYFQRAASIDDQIREIPLYLQLCASKLGKQVDTSQLLQP